MNNDNSEIFLNTYRDLEEVLGVKYGEHMGLVQEFAENEGERFREELNVFREIRNLLSHHGMINGQPPAQPSDSSVEKLAEILEYAKNPPVALSLSTPRKSLFCADGDDLITVLLDKMEQRGYSHIPVIGGRGELVGVFSVGTLFALTKEQPEKGIQGVKISDISRYLAPEAHRTEQFGFVAPEASVEKLKEMFRNNGPYSRRVAALFVTKGADPASRLLGMLTPWDVIKAF